MSNMERIELLDLSDENLDRFQEVTVRVSKKIYDHKGLVLKIAFFMSGIPWEYCLRDNDEFIDVVLSRGYGFIAKYFLLRDYDSRLQKVLKGKRVYAWYWQYPERVQTSFTIDVLAPAEHKRTEKIDLHSLSFDDLLPK